MARAQRGRFSREDGRAVPKATLSRFFVEEADGFQAKPELQRLCSFRTGDLLRDRYEQGFDLILCRNVVIYFTEATRNQVHTNLARALRPGGFLMVGATERVTNPAEIGPRAQASLHLPQGRLMDISDYLPMFLAEGREHLQNLNLALVRLEQDQKDAETTQRDLPDRALAEGHVRDDGLRAHGCADRTRWRTSSSCCARATTACRTPP